MSAVTILAQSLETIAIARDGTADKDSDDGVVRATGYDLLGRVTSVVEPDDGQGSAELHLVTGYEYDNAGRRVAVTNPRGYTTAYGFDAAGRPTTIGDAATRRRRRRARCRLPTTPPRG